LSKSKFIVSEDSSILEEIQFDSFSKIRKYLVKITYPYADKIIVLTQSGKLKLLSLIPNSKTKIVIKKNWLPLKFSSKNFNFRSKRNIDILFIGRLEPQKNPFEFIDIINLLIKNILN
jgi:glycosyltransferase involved in cell wall biosynthesis